MLRTVHQKILTKTSIPLGKVKGAGTDIKINDYFQNSLFHKELHSKINFENLCLRNVNGRGVMWDFVSIPMTLGEYVKPCAVTFRNLLLEEEVILLTLKRQTWSVIYMYIYGLSAYRAVKTLHPGYKQPISWCRVRQCCSFFQDL